MALPATLTDAEVEAQLTEPEWAAKLEQRASRLAEDRAPERMLVDGVPHPLDERLDAIWEGREGGFSEAKAREEVINLESMRAQLAEGRIRPRNIIGTGYRGDTRKMANDYLDRSQAELERALEVRGRNLTINVRNAAIRHRRALETSE